MTQSPQNSSRGLTRLIVVVATAAAVLVCAEWVSSRMVTDSPAESSAKSERPENVTIVLKDPDKLPDVNGEQSVWVVGNSHTYALPGMQQGDPLRTDEQGILIDEMAARILQRSPGAKANFYLLAYPNFLPFEMLSRVGHLIYRGHRPTIVFIGLTWRNIARDSQLRHEVYQAYRDPAFSESFAAMLREKRVAAAPDVMDAIESQRKRIARDVEAERLRSDSDRIDEVLTAWLGKHLTLMGKSADLRAQAFRALTDRVQRLWDDRKNVKYSYDLVEHDYVFNFDCLRAMVRLLKENGATVYCYFAPERSDLPPLLDPEKQQVFIAEFSREAEQLGVTVLDARHVVPNEYWGWVGDSPDRSHFTEPGHQRLAQFLLDEADKRSAWKELSQP